MKILVFDTETGGCSPEENDILQLSYQVVDTDTEEVVKEVNHYFPWPDEKWRVTYGGLQIDTNDINLHDSSADVELTKRCFMHLLNEGFYQL